VKATWSVLVVYENEHSRQLAVDFCDRLVERFWAKCGFDVNWASYEAIDDRKKAEELAAKAAEAGIIAFAHEGRRDFSWPLRVWVETWLTLRGEREGKLVGLCAGQMQHQKLPAGFSYLRQIAHRAGMDFITDVPQNILEPIPDSPDMVLSRASYVTSVLDGILHQPSRPRTT